jgi:hypothetical protein
MANTRIFDRETLLDLVVNGVPLFILAFFFLAFIITSPFGFDPLANGMQLVLIGWIFVALGILTYLSAKAIAGDEKRAEVYPPGQATVSGVDPIEDEHAIESAESGDEA